MHKLINTIRTRHQNRNELSEEAGLTTVEYIIILCLIAIFAFGAWQKFGAKVGEKVEGSTDAVDTLDTSTTQSGN